MSNLRIDRVQLEIIIGNDKARKRMAELEADTKQYKKELKLLHKQGKEGTEEYIAKVKQLQKAQAEYDELIEKIGLTGLTTKELQKRQRELNVIMKNLAPNTAEYKLYEEQLQAVNTRLVQLKAGSKAAATSQVSLKSRLGGIANAFNKYSMLVASVVASLTGLVFSFRKVIDVYNEYEEKVDELSALTGLQGDELDWLSGKARELAITTNDAGVRITQSAGDIATAFKTVGSQRPELLAVKEDLASVTEDAIILSEAAKSELDPAVTALTTTLNQFNLGAEESRRVINSIAAGSKVGAGDVEYISTAMEKAGTTMQLLNIEVEEGVGLIETVAPKYKKAATAGNSLDKVLLKMKEKQIGFNDGVFDMNAALEELQSRFANGETAVSIFGAEHAKLVEILVGSQEEFNYYTEAVTDTNIAIEQAIINTDNNAAALSQAKNKVEENAIVLGEKLAPVLTFSTNAFNYLLKALVAVVENWDLFKKILITGGATLLAYTVLVEGVTIAKKAYAFAVDIAKKATDMFNKTVKANPWGIILTAITAVVTALLVFEDRIKEANKSVREFNEELINEQTELNNLFDALKKTNPGTEARKELIDEINEAYGEYLPAQLTERSNLLEIAEAQEIANEALEKSIAIKYRDLSLEEARTDAVTKRVEKTEKILRAMADDTEHLYAAASETLNDLIDESIAAGEVNAEMAEAFYQEYLKSNYVVKGEMFLLIEEIIDAEEKKNKEVLRLNALYNGYIGEDTEEYYNEELMALRKQLLQKLITEEQYYEKKAELQAKYGIDYFPETDTGYVDDDEDDDEETSYYTDNTQDIVDANKEMLSYIREIRKELMEDEKEKALEEIELWKEKEVAKVEESLASTENKNNALLAIEDMYQKKLTDLEDEYNQKRIDDFETVAEFISETEADLATEKDKIIEAEIEKINAKYQEQIDLLSEYEDTQDQIAELEKLRAEEVAAYKLEKEKELAEEIQSVKEEYDLLTNEDLMEADLLKLQEYYDQKLLTTEEYELAKSNIEEKYRLLNEQATQEALDEEMQLFIDQIEAKKMVIEGFGNFFRSVKDLELEAATINEEKQKQIRDQNYEHEIKAAGDNEEKIRQIDEKYADLELKAAKDSEEKQKQIKKKYADIDFAIAIGKIVANTALAIAKAQADLPLGAAQIYQGVLAATAAAQMAVAAVERAKVSQLKKGKYQVMGADDGRIYNAFYKERIDTGIIHRPTLVAEEPEAVIDHRTLYNPKRDKLGMTVMDHFNSIKAIKFSKVPQFAEGKYEVKTNSTGENPQETGMSYSDLINEVRALREDINNWKSALRAYVVYQDVEDAENEINEIRENSSVNK